eukprot:TRINITY_DN23274_c0_g2_i3.p1 TRINITY_DN23274_c0_g2~~TRINITY_DN23274_c0_g2_i3.p1  ORF type:complete len:371 (+),score=55.37 TRINITY_DN23274_c0_g2_i3:143-1255(+)
MCIRDSINAEYGNRIMEDMEDWGRVEVTGKCYGAMSCRVVAPVLFKEVPTCTTDHGAFSQCHRDLASSREYSQARQAIMVCPSKAIRFARLPACDKRAGAEQCDLFGEWPRHLEDQVYDLGCKSAETFGASGYLIRGKDPNGEGVNMLVDPPAPEPRLLETLRAMGGVQFILFTHIDHVGYHPQWHQALSEGDQQPPPSRVLHRSDMLWKADQSPFPPTDMFEQVVELAPFESMKFAPCPSLDDFNAWPHGGLHVFAVQSQVSLHRRCAQVLLDRPRAAMRETAVLLLLGAATGERGCASPALVRVGAAWPRGAASLRVVAAGAREPAQVLGVDEVSTQRPHPNLEVRTLEVMPRGWDPHRCEAPCVLAG